MSRHIFDTSHDRYEEFKSHWHGISQWGIDRNIVSQSTSKDQFLKLMTEFSELIGADSAALEFDALCDMVVVCIMIANIEQLKIDAFSAMHDEFAARSATPTEDTPVASQFLGFLLGKLADSILRKNSFTLACNLFEIINTIDRTARMKGHDDLIDGLLLVLTELNTRHGTFFNGAFVKNTDPDYENILDKVKLELANNFMSK